MNAWSEDLNQIQDKVVADSTDQTSIELDDVSVGDVLLIEGDWGSGIERKLVMVVNEAKESSYPVPYVMTLPGLLIALHPSKVHKMTFIEMTEGAEVVFSQEQQAWAARDQG